MSQLEPTSVAIPGQQTHGDTVFPYVFFCNPMPATLTSATEWVASQRQVLLSLATRHGAVLLRDFPVANANDFDALITTLELINFPYEKSLSNAVRINKTPRVFSANEAPPDVRIFFHHEMAQTPLYPKWIFFHCEVAPDEGGATPLCRSDVLYQRLCTNYPDFIEACEAKGLKYTNVMPDTDDPNSGMGRSWLRTLGVTSREAAERRLAELNYSWEWQDNGCLTATTPPLPAVALTEGRKVFFNQLIAAFCGWKDARNDPSQSIRHGDGTPLDRAAVLAAVDIAEDLAFELQWHSGDVALIDNTITMHARRPFRGTRSVVASLAEMQVQSFTVTP